MGLTLCLWGAAGAAAPWADPGDTGLRNDIELLADAGVLSGPVTTWPLAWAGIAADLERAQPPAGAAAQAAILRLRKAVGLATEIDRARIRVGTSLSTDPRPLRSFENSPREEGEVSAALEWTGLRFSYRLKLTAVSDPSDDLIARADDSYFGVVLGNYMLLAGQLDRWWGPGWQGSLILSTSARPIPGVALQRNFTDAPDVRWLRWVGPWTVTTLMGQMEHGRNDVADPLFFGFRVNFRPREDLEIGLSRTAQWCGSDRVCDLGTFADLLLGRDNRGDTVDLENEPGNQLAGLDWRWRLPTRQRLSWYGEFVGEDEAGGLPSRFIGLSGLTWSGYSERWLGSLSARLEIADTTAEFYKETKRFDFAYEHEIYTDGYRYRNRSIGHGMDNDGRMLAFSLMLHRDDGQQWLASIRRVDLNRGGMRANTVAATSRDLINIEVSHRREFGSGELSVGLGFDSFDGDAGEDDTDVRLHAAWRGEL